MEEMRRLHQSGLLLFLGNDESGMNYAGNPYPFRQDSTFLYFFGLDFPGLAALIDMEDGKVGGRGAYGVHGRAQVPAHEG